MTRDSSLDLSKEEIRDAKRMHADAIVIDGLVPTTAYIADPKYRTHLGLGGVTAGNVTVASRSRFIDATERVQQCRSLVTANDDAFMLIETAEDIPDAKDSGKTGVILGFQDTMPIEPSERMQVDGGFEFLRAFHEMGVRVVQLTYNSLNYVGAGCCERTDPGLSNFGRTVVTEMNQLGVLIDLSHCGDHTTMEAMSHSEKPVVISHTGARALSNVKRNKTDEQLRTIADNGGVVGVSVFPPTVKTDPETHDVQAATIHDVLDHIDHIVSVAGIDHVGFGSDMNDKALDDGVTPPYAAYRNFRPQFSDVYGRGPIEEYEPFPRGLNRHTELPNLTRGLVARGYSETDVQKILGENFFRVFEETWNH